jgi:hypothetical protein
MQKTSTPAAGSPERKLKPATQARIARGIRKFSPAIQVSTREYASSHGAQPRGLGGWMFLFGDSREELEGRERAVNYLSFVWMPPGGAKLYGAALKLAKAEARERGASWIGVCS